MKKQIRLIFNNGSEYRTSILRDNMPRLIKWGNAVFRISAAESEVQCYFQIDNIPNIFEIEV